MEAELNSAKNLLNRPDFGTLRNSSLFEVSLKNLQKSITKQFQAQHVTKAWLKMVGLLQGPVWERLKAGPVKAFFNAELPGGFVFASNHLFRTHKIPFSWVIASYYPENQTGDFIADSFGILRENSLVGFLQTNQGPAWCDGDLTKPKMSNILAKLCLQKLGKVNLYTADGGFDVTGRENQQEILSIPLIMGEVQVGIQVLEIGGILILKIFTFFTPQMQNLIIWLGRHFQEYSLVKPGASSPINSELYFVGIGFKGMTTLPIQVEMTPEESQFIKSNLEFYTRNQISAIQDFLNGKSSPLDTSIYQSLLPLEVADRVYSP